MLFLERSLSRIPLLIMNDSHCLNYNHLLTKLSKYARNQFSGRLTVKVDKISSWRIYFNTGSIIWATGGIHPVRRWLRQLKQCGCEITVPKGMTQKQLLSSYYECWDYFALASLMQDNHVNPKQVKSIVEGTISEVLFDLVQTFAEISSQDIDQIRMLRKQGVQPCPKQLLLPAWMCHTEAAKQRILPKWQNWVAAGFSNYSPNLGIVANQEELNRQGWHSLAQYFYQIEKTEKTLRDIATQNDKNLLIFLQTISSYYHQNLIQFKSVPDLWQNPDNPSQQHSGFNQGQFTGPVIQNNPTQVSSNVKQLPLSMPVSGWRRYSGLSTTSSQALPSQEGIKVNVMEALVAEEATRQIKTLPPKCRTDINQLDVATYALNRLPPLYAASQEGIAHQTKTAKENHQLAIKTEVQRAIAIVRRDPLRRSTRITSRDQV
ncbi:MAG: hypothetical protein BRC33_04900 [Cyanobacteria bacterium SW_9_44_58]|nr:MAG: hypothetical protein BRC33_04900 [Cyanobacteria bacterium SW_9_44_58]